MADETQTVWKAEDIGKFMESPLVQWIKTFKISREALDFEELSDSVFLLDVLLTIDGGNDSELMTAINRSASLDYGAKLHNWMLLICTLHKYYSEGLRQLIVFTWPDIFIIANEIDKGDCVMELQKLLILILGYAVQCDGKEERIESIKRLDVNVQQSLVLHIQQITDHSRNVICIVDGLQQLDYTIIGQILEEICRDRLQMMEKLVTAKQANSASGSKDIPKKIKTCQAVRSLSLNPQLNEEENEIRQQIRSLNEELIEKATAIKEMREQLSNTGSELSKLRSENAILAAEANAARIYKDELDVMKEMALQGKKDREEIEKYRNMIADVNFYKTRLEELRKDNDLLTDSKAKIESQLTTSTKRIEKMTNELAIAQIQLENNNSEKSELNKRLIELTEENAKLEYEKSQTRIGLMTSTLNRFTSITSIDCLPPTDVTALNQQNHCNSISDEMNETLKSCLTRMQVENDELKLKLNEMTNKYQDREQNLEQLHRQRESELQKKLETMQQEFSEQRLKYSKQLSKEFEQKACEIELQSKLIKENISKEHQAKLGDLAQQNQRLQQHIEELQKQISFIEESWKQERETCAKSHVTNDDLQWQMKRGTRENFHDNKDTLKPKEESIDNESINLQNQLTKKTSNLCHDNTCDKNHDISHHHIFSQDGLTKYGDISKRENTTKKENTLECSSTDDKHTPQENKYRTPVRGIVTPLMRSAETPKNNAKQDHGDSSIKHSANPPKHTQDLIRERHGSAFIRNDALRYSMPIRIPSSHQPHHSRSSSSRHWVIDGKKLIPPNISNQNKQHSIHRDNLSPYCNRSSLGYTSGQLQILDRSTTDGSYQTSLNSSTISEATGLDHGRKRSQKEYRDSSGGRPQWHLSSYSEKTVTETVTESMLGDENGRCRALVDQLMKLQAHGQLLASTNTKLEDRNLELEAENKKLKLIIEALHGTVPQSLYDKHTYQFNTIV